MSAKELLCLGQFFMLPIGSGFCCLCVCLSVYHTHNSNGQIRPHSGGLISDKARATLCSLQTTAYRNCSLGSIRWRSRERLVLNDLNQPCLPEIRMEFVPGQVSLVLNACNQKCLRLCLWSLNFGVLTYIWVTLGIGPRSKHTLHLCFVYTLFFFWHRL